MKSQPAYYEKISKAGDVTVRRKARNAALNAVKSFLYEYAPHEKSQISRGVSPKFGPDGKVINKFQVAFTAGTSALATLMHFPLSLLNMQVKFAKGAHKAIKAGQYDAPELEYYLRYAGIYAAIQLGSVISNMNFNNILENDTINRGIEINKTLGGAIESEL